MTFIYFLLLLSVIICIHEGGHLAAAKFFNVYCYEYSFGMGPALLQKKGKETIYSIRAIPIGGFVSMAGEADGDEAYPDVEVPAGRRLNELVPWKRIIIMLAGVFMNFVLAWVIFSLIMLGNGSYSDSPKAMIGEVMENSPAEAAGLKAGDIVKTITSEGGNSVKPKTYLDMQMFLAENNGEAVFYTVERDGETMTFEIVPEYMEEYERYMIGIVGPEAETHPVGFLNCWKYGLIEMQTLTVLMLRTLASLLRGYGLNQLSGPVGIYSAAGEAASMGALAFLFLVGELSLNIGIFNLLPLPVLDGGQVVLTLCEMTAGRPLNTKIKTGIMAVCWVLLIGIMLFVTWNDISRLIH